MSQAQTPERNAANLINPTDTRYRVTRKVSLVGAGINLLLAAIKILIGITGHSQALIADGIHSLSDLATDAMVLLSAKHGSKAADANHPYGHGRIETAFTVGLGAVLIATAIGIVYDATQRLFSPELLEQPDFSVIGVAVLSVFANEFLYFYTVNAAKKIRSNLLRANAWHHRSDSVSSIVVIVGVAGTMAGLPYLDAIAAIGVALMIVKIGVELGWNSIQELVDTAIEPEQVERISEKIRSVDGVQTFHMLRTRRMGGDALVDVHILVDPKLSVSEGHKISESVQASLIDDLDEVTDVTVHIDPEDDETSKPSGDLPLRQTILQALNEHWSGFEEAKYIQNVTLHYLGGKIQVELELPLQKMSSIDHARLTAKKFAAIAQKEDEISEIKVHFF